MQSDIRDWNEIDKNTKDAISYILKGFAQTEMEVKDYWTACVPGWFPVPEIQNMAVAFGNWETIHAYAYDYLNETLGIKNHDEFLHDEVIMAKLDALIEVKEKEVNNVYDMAKSIAVFSAACEGIQLFSSFSILLSFRLSNQFKGIGQQMFWSIRDESTHSEAGCKLFNVLCDENPELLIRDMIRHDITDGIELALTNEFAVINKVFENGDLPNINKAQVKNFMYDRANRKMLELGYTLDDSPWKDKVDKQLLQEMDWFYLMISSEQQTDFFDNRETNYSKGNENWNTDDLF